MMEKEFYDEITETTNLINQNKIKPSYIANTFKEDLGTKIDISWFNNMYDPIGLKNVGIIRSMLESANELVNLVIDGTMADRMYPAILFCYTHYLELALKVIIERHNRYYVADSAKIITIPKSPTGHEITNIWNSAKDTIREHMKLSDNEYLCIEKIVENLTNLSDTSMAYRYATTKGSSPREYLDNNSFGADLNIVRMWVNVLDEYLLSLYDDDWSHLLD